jgi:AraC family transcriptional activator of pobA
VYFCVLYLEGVILFISLLRKDDMADNEKNIRHFSLNSVDLQELSGYASQIFSNDDLVLVMNGIPKNGMFLREGEIYNVVEPRIVIVMRGSGDISLNLEDYHIEQGSVIMTSSNIILEIKGISDDAKVIGIVFRKDIEISEETVVDLSSIEFSRLLRMVQLAWDMSHVEPYRKDVVLNMMRAVVADLEFIRIREDQVRENSKVPRDQELFRQFKYLVHQYCNKERSLPFYADKLGITPHHLSAVIRKASDKSVMYWINRAVILKAKLMLRTSNLLGYEIADRLNFPSDSAFSRFFKRETGITPKQYSLL